MLTAKYSNKGVYFKGDSIYEELSLSEAIAASSRNRYSTIVEVIENGKSKKRRIERAAMDWTTLVSTDGPFVDHHSFKYAKNWGLSIKGLDKIAPIVNSKRRKKSYQAISVNDFVATREYAIAEKRIKDLYGNGFPDGSKLFNYQIRSAATAITKKRLILGLDMGLGKTRTTLVALTSRPANKKILIVTMSRNIRDWETEIHSLGLEDDYIIINNRCEMKSEKRIHLVSYERWASEKTVFKTKVHDECPRCKTNVAWKQELQYCGFCKKQHKSNEIYNEKDLPIDCPQCGDEWKKGRHHCSSCDFTVIKQRKKPLSAYMNRSYNAAAIDEAHLIKNGTSMRTKSIMAIKTDIRIALSGTPAENGADDLFWILSWVYGDSYNFIDPLVGQRFNGFGKIGETHFRMYFGGKGKRALMDSKSIEARASNEGELWTILEQVMIRKKKSDDDVAKEICVPVPTHRRLHLKLNEAERQLYDKRLEEFREWYKNEWTRKEAAEIRKSTYRISTIEVCSWLDKLRKVASCPWVMDDYDASLPGEPAKLKVLKDKVKEYALQGKKLLVFTAHKKTAEQLGILLGTVVPGHTSAYIHGSVPMDYRHDLMAEFQDKDSKLTTLVMTMRTGAESYTLTEAKGVVLYDLDFNAKKIEQCYSRAVRMGQKDVVEITWLIGLDTIDANMHALVLSKQSGVDLAIDRKALDFEQVASEFESDGNLEVDSDIDYTEFATEMLKRGNNRSDYVS
ncbi:SNF2-related protein [Viridibacillus arvi]|uniref:SNF2-related protein n=1 Tax=Viridibacillus arvi TaxID=263475 RepID=UPI0034CE6F94